MTDIAVAERPARSVLVDMSARYGMEPAAFEATLRATVCKGQVSREEFAAFLLVAKEYGLNPMTKELYAFPAKGGGIQPIVSIDGWARIINDHPMFDGMEFEDVREGDELVAITCRMHRKDRGRAIEATEYMGECKRATDVWRTWPRRMLRHKAMIQCARYAFGFSGIVDPDEFERMETVRDVTAREAPNLSARLAAPREEDAPREGFSTIQAEFTDTDAATTAEAASEPALDDGAGDTSPGAPQAEGEGDAAESAEAHAVEETGSAADLLAWADNLKADVDGLSLEQIEAVLGNPNDQANFAELERTQPQIALDLNRAIGRRKREVA